MADGDEPRRSSRKRNTKSALELLGIGVHKEVEEKIGNDTDVAEELSVVSVKKGRGRPPKRKLNYAPPANIPHSPLKQIKVENDTKNTPEQVSKGRRGIGKRESKRGDSDEKETEIGDTSEKLDERIETSREEAESSSVMEPSIPPSQSPSISKNTIMISPVNKLIPNANVPSTVAETEDTASALEHEGDGDKDPIPPAEQIAESPPIAHNTSPETSPVTLSTPKDNSASPNKATRSGRVVRPKSRYDPDPVARKSKPPQSRTFHEIPIAPKPKPVPFHGVTLKTISKGDESKVKVETKGTYIMADLQNTEVTYSTATEEVLDVSTESDPQGQELSADQKLAQQVLSALAAGGNVLEPATGDGGVTVYEVQVQGDEGESSKQVLTFEVVNQNADTPSQATVEGVTASTEPQRKVTIVQPKDVGIGFTVANGEEEDDDSPDNKCVTRGDGSLVYSAAYFKNKREGKAAHWTPSNKQHIMTDYLQHLMAKLKPDEDWEPHTYISESKERRCKYCDKPVVDKKRFRNHMTKHPDAMYRPWKCPECSYRSHIRAGIARHINIHSNKKPYYCAECGKGFNFRQKLTLHMKYHLDIRDRQCPLCTMAFHEYKTLKNHLTKIHNEPNYPTPRSKKDKHKLESLLQLAAERRAEKEAYLKSIVPEENGGANDNSCPRRNTQQTVEVLGAIVNDAGEETLIKKLRNTAPHTNKRNINIVRQGTKDVVFGDFTKAKEASEDASGRQEEEDVVVEEMVEESHQPGDLEDGQLILGEQQNVAREEVPVIVKAEQNAADCNPATDPKTIPELNIPGQEYSHKASVTNKHSMLHGTRKTLRNTELYQSGRLPEQSVSTISKTVVKDHNIQGKSNRGRRSLTANSTIETCLLAHCCMETDPQNHCVLRCTECPESAPRFSTKTAFIHHLESSHAEIRAWKCNQCEYTARMRTSLIVHLKIHTGIKEFHCEICNKFFAFRQKLKNHMKHHMNLREHACDFCDKRFNEKGDLSKHIKRIHMPETPIQCDMCEKTFKDKIQLRRHRESHVGMKRFSCQYCKKTYRSKMSLCQHLKSHTCMFHCEICDKSFGSYSGFMAHKVMHDESYEGYRCELCDKILHTKGSLHRHKTVSHSDERPFECHQCRKRFKTKKDIKHHELVHLSTRKFACNICEYRCKRLESLRIHLRRHDDVKPYTCGECGKEYTQKRALQNHLRQHSKSILIRCNICGRNFQNKSYLDAHIAKKHHKESDQLQLQQMEQKNAMTVFMCEECNSVFLSQDSLAVHILAEHMKQGFVGGMKVKLANDPQGGAESVPQGHSVFSLPEAPAGTKLGSASTTVQDAVRNDSSEEEEEFTGQEAVETLITISDPSNRGRVVSLIQPVDQEKVGHTTTKSHHPISGQIPATIDQVEGEDSSPESKFASLMNANEQSEETYVAIMDPNTHQEMLVHASNIDTLLAATEAEVGSLENTARGQHETYVIEETDQDGLQSSTGTYVIEESVESPTEEQSYVITESSLEGATQQGGTYIIGDQQGGQQTYMIENTENEETYVISEGAQQVTTDGEYMITTTSASSVSEGQTFVIEAGQMDEGEETYVIEGTTQGESDQE